MDASALSTRPTRSTRSTTPAENWPELALLCAGGIALALVELLFARTSSRAAVIRYDRATNLVSHSTRWVWAGHSLFDVSLVIATTVALAGVALLALVRRHRVGGTALVQIIRSDWHVAVTVASFYVGTLVAALIRFGLGTITISSFATGSAPIVAGMLVGVIVAGVDENGRFPWHRQLALMYLLIGSLATALGTIPAPDGWLWGVCFLVIFGGLAASVCLTIDIAVGRANTSSTTGSHHSA